MTPAPFEYLRPKSLDETFALLEKYGDRAKLLAGGHSLIPMMKLRLADPGVLIDIAALPGLSGIESRAGHTRIGALTTHAMLAASAELRASAPALWEAANQLGDPQVRNRGTIGGACAHADPAADYPAVMLALDATFELNGKQGRREVSADRFFRGLFETALGAAEVVERIRFDDAPQSAYLKLHHAASHYAVVGVSVKLQIKDNAISAARVGVTGLGDMAFRANGVEAALAGLGTSDEAAIRAACAGTARGVDARSDLQASALYRSAMADVFAARAVLAAVAPR